MSRELMKSIWKRRSKTVKGFAIKFPSPPNCNSGGREEQREGVISVSYFVSGGISVHGGDEGIG